MKEKQSIFLFAFLLSILLSITSFAQTSYTNRHRVYIDIGVPVGTNSQSWVLGGYGALGVFIGKSKRPICIDARAKEMYYNSPQREAGAISLTLRVYLKKGFYWGAGFAHNHEIGIHDFTNEPIGSILGSSPHIIHRSGLAGEIGYDLKPFPRKTWLGVYPAANLGVAYFVLDNQPNPLITLSLGFKFGMKPLPGL
jgi:hypothetical protein